MTDVPPAPQPPEQPATPGGTTPPPAAPEAPAAPAAPAAPVNPYAQQPSAPYGQPAAAPYGAPGYGAPQEKTNVLSIVSLCLGIAGFILLLPLIGPIGSIITGHMSLSQIKRTGEKGRGMALTGLILGYVAIVLGILFIAALFAIGIWGSTATYSTFDDFS